MTPMLFSLRLYNVAVNNSTLQQLDCIKMEVKQNVVGLNLENVFSLAITYFCNKVFF